MQNSPILKTIGKFAIPFIILFGLYIQLHGEYSPGGGFQAGAIVVCAFIIYLLLYGKKALQEKITLNFCKKFAIFGVFLYFGMGLFNMFLGGNFLEYNTLHQNMQTAQKIGIIIIELGVGIGVFASLLAIILIMVNAEE